ncbi:Z1 domain-containing protein [Kitasatospora sp. NPDC048194]|uniref:Z1 domain-containing protein n=1 Tax=Kitasatospora sp. NPDC048194 TaxID=3364045 RepID=UPI003716FE49
MTLDPMTLALNMAETMLLATDRPGRSSEEIGRISDTVHKMLSAAGHDIPAERIARELEARFDVWVPREVWVADPKGHAPWLADRHEKIEWSYWDRYKTWLTRRSGWKPPAVESLSDSTDTVLSLLEDPLRPGEWSVKGLTYGQVQSGKTANYTGLICKAVDAGYQVVVVLTGAHESLRHQTQTRLDLEFLGFNSRFTRQQTAESIEVGVGNLGMRNPRLCQSITTRDKDFSVGAFESTRTDPRRVCLLAVVKKNARILANLRDWLGNFATEQADGRRLITEVPLLLIDDEADYASVDTKKPRRGGSASDAEHDPTRINQCIRDVLSLFEKRAYVAYTATPFANIFISDEIDHPEYGDDLFPRSFMVALSPPSNYCGPEVVFGLEDPTADVVREPLPVIRDVADEAAWMPDGHTKDHQPPSELPASLRQAIDAFVLATAARKARSEYFGSRAGHNTMLVHVTRFKAVQFAVARQLKEHLRAMDDLWGDRGAAGTALRERLRDLWEQDFVPTYAELADRSDLTGLVGEPLEYDQVESVIGEVLTECADGVKTINGEAADVLEYESNTPATVIAVGGDKLSRGLTLEGLTVSYYLRASRTYDTLMQMGRWFGYRSGYLDVTRLYTTRELVDSYVHVTRANRELMDLVSSLAAAGLRPVDVGLRVQDGYEHLQVTAAAKMRNSTVLTLSSAGQRPETLYMRTTEQAMVENHARLERLVDAIKDYEPVPEELRHGAKGLMRSGVPAEVVIEFLDGFAASSKILQARPQSLVEYITRQNGQGELTNWTIAVTSGSAATTFAAGGETFRMVKRKLLGSASTISAGTDFQVGVLVSPDHEAIGLPQDVHDRAFEATRREFSRRKDRAPQRPSGAEIRRHRDPREGLLLVYPVDPTGRVEGIQPEGVPMVGYALSLPNSDTATPTRYRVNETYLRELQQMVEDDDDVEGDDE